MDKANYFWKNFRLGTELQISGSFIYNALFTLENMETFYYEEECFEFLYHASVGLERLEKVAIILIEHEESHSQEEFEKSLVTHDHRKLIKRIRDHRMLNLGKVHTKFLTLLSNFYKSVRYDRYNLSSVYHPVNDKKELIQFISEELKIDIVTDLPFSTGVTPEIKRFIGKIIGKIAVDLYEIIRSEAYRLNTNTYELAYNSKAFKIFISKEFDFSREKLMQREVCLYLLKSLPDGELKKFIDGIKPLEFGQFHSNFYFENMFNYHKDRSILDEIQHHYEENKFNKTREEEIMALGSNINFDDFDLWAEKDEEE